MIVLLAILAGMVIGGAFALGYHAGSSHTSACGSCPAEDHCSKKTGAVKALHFELLT
jgi:hypothetical protein